ncbi:MAG: alpha-L-fucosidase [Bryobacteraceae bacterium]
MNRRTFNSFLAGGIASAEARIPGISAADAQIASPSADEDRRTAWYRNAKFGMFIHWGPYSVASVEASWPIMRPSKQFPITEMEYRALPARFNPAHFDPDAWVALAQSAGQRYMVFTTKHHDGFCMFDSAFTNYKITNTPYGKDIVAQLAAAAHRAHMPIGFYYSPPDMNHPAYRDTSQPASKNWHGEPTREVWPLYLDYMKLQLRELLTRYGRAALIWFDGLDNQRKYDGYRMARIINNCQPDTLMNNRIGITGDFETPEQFIPSSIPVKGSTLDFDHRKTGTKPGYVPPPQDFQLWETCMTINNTWAYNKNDRHFKSVKELVRTLIKVASKGGNFLLDVGPEPDGTIQPEFQERLRAMGKWLRANGEAIYGTTYGPLQTLTFGKTTRKGNNVYLEIFDWPSSGVLHVPGLSGKVRFVSLLNGNRTLHFHQAASALNVDLAGIQPDPYATVLNLSME